MGSDSGSPPGKEVFALPDAEALGRAVARLARAARQATLGRSGPALPRPEGAPPVPASAPPEMRALPGAPQALDAPGPVIGGEDMRGAEWPGTDSLEAAELESRVRAIEGLGIDDRELTAPADDNAPRQLWSLAEIQRMVEAILFTSAEALSAQEIAALLPAGAGSEIGTALARLKQAHAGRGVVLAEAAGKWRFQTAPDLAFLFQARAEAPKLGRAALETLAVIAWHQPVTRAEIEDVRGVSLGRGTLDALLESGLVRPRSRRKAPGRPLTFGTTPLFLEIFGLDSVESLPGREEMRSAGLLELRLPADFLWPKPATGLGEDEEALPDSPDDPQFRLDFLDDGPEPESGTAATAVDGASEDTTSIAR